MAYGDFGWGDDPDGGYDGFGHCEGCGKSTHNDLYGTCYSCRQAKVRAVRPEDVGFYVSGWIWDPEYPDLRHRTLHTFGPFETEKQAWNVMENLSPATDNAPTKYEPNPGPSLWHIKASDVPKEKPEGRPKGEEFFRNANGVRTRLPLAKKLHINRSVWSEDR